MQTIASWSKPSFVQSEELSCSYISSRKNREDLIHNYEQEYPSMSEDITDYENSNLIDERNRSVDDYENLIDANDLRQRLKKLESLNNRSSYSRQESPSRRYVNFNIYIIIDFIKEFNDYFILVLLHHILQGYVML